jgi:hypothetical protein
MQVYTVKKVIMKKKNNVQHTQVSIVQNFFMEAYCHVEAEEGGAMPAELGKHQKKSLSI